MIVKLTESNIVVGFELVCEFVDSKVGFHKVKLSMVDKF